MKPKPPANRSPKPPSPWESSPGGRPRGAGMVWAFVVFGVAVLAFLAFKLTVRTTEKTGADIRDGAKTVYMDAKKGVKDFAAFASGLGGTFNSRIRETTNSEGLTSVEGKLRLELATAEVIETFRESDKQYIAWRVYLGETVSEITVPATFRYHLDPAAKWEVRAKDKSCVVIAPRIEPSLPVAIHTDRMEKHAASGWARFDRDKRLNELERRITPELALRAGDAAHIAQVREQARRSVAQFVRTWLLREEMWRSDAFTSVVVVFEDEALQPGQVPPTLTLQP